MSAAIESPIGDKELLLARSALCRLKLRLRADDVRASIGLKRIASDVARAPAVGRIAFGLSIAGLGGAARLLVIAARILVIGRLAATLLGRFR